jgi:hypothetical protein
LPLAKPLNSPSVTYQILSALPPTSSTDRFLFIASDPSSLAMGTTIPRATMKAPHTTIGISFGGGVSTLHFS